MAERPKKILIVGGVVGGATVAIRLRQLNEQFEITIVDRNDNIALVPSRLPFYIEGTIRTKEALFEQTVQTLHERYRVAVLSRHDAIRIDRFSKELVVRDLRQKTKRTLPYDRLILSPGAAPIRPHIEGMDSPLVKTLRTLDDAEEILELLRRRTSHDDPVVVMGGSSLGLEMVETFRRRGLSVILLEAARQVMIGADIETAAPLHRVLRRNGVDLRFGVSVSRLFQESGERIRLFLHENESIAARFVVVAAGVRPEVNLALDAGLKLGLTGGISVNDRMQTDDPDIYAIGDAVEIKVSRNGKSLPCRIASDGATRRQATVAADHLVGFRHHPYLSFGGTSLCTVFDTTVAVTGSSEKQLSRERIPFEKVYVPSVGENNDDRETGAMMLKILFSPDDGRLFGAQAIGREDVCRRIDVLVTAIRFGGTVRQLCDLELCAPSRSLPEDDPVRLAGNIASDLLDDLVRHATRKEMKRPKAHQVILDLRPSTEYESSHVDGALSLPLEELPRRLDELSREKEYLVYSLDGLQGYVACRILLQHGFRAKNFPGGLDVYRELTGTSFSKTMNDSSKSADGFF